MERRGIRRPLSAAVTGVSQWPHTAPKPPARSNGSAESNGPRPSRHMPPAMGHAPGGGGKHAVPRSVHEWIGQRVPHSALYFVTCSFPGRRRIITGGTLPAAAVEAYNRDHWQFDCLVPGRAGKPLDVAFLERRGAVNGSAGSVAFGRWLEHWGLEHLLYMVLALNDCDVRCVVLGRKRGEGPFTEDDVKTVRELMPIVASLQAQMRLRRRLAALKAGFDAISAAQKAAHVVISPTRHILELDCCAEEMLANNDGFVMHDGSLCASSPEDNTRLEAACRSATRDRRINILRVARSQAPVPYHVAVQPLPRNDGSEPDSTLVVVQDPSSRREPVAERVREAFGMTHAESRLAASVGAGFPIAGAARECGITYATARTYLKRVLRKTGDSSQVELVHRLSRITALFL